MRIKQFHMNLRKISVGTLKEVAFVLFFCNPFIARFFMFLFSHLGIYSLSRLAMLIVVYTPVFLILLVSPKSIPKDFFLLLSAVFFFALVTYMIHPEYEFWYTRNYYGLWDYVLRPDNGIYAYFFIRLLNNPNWIMKALKKSAWVMYPYYGYLLYSALTRGYWISTGSAGQTIHLSYDLSFGYDMLLFTLVFFYAALKQKKVVDIIMTGIGFGMILFGGSRGPLLCIAIFIALYFIINLVQSKHKGRIGFAVSFIVLLLAYCYEYILGAIIIVMNYLGISSRTVMMLLEGTIANDNGRDKIWNAAIQMIKDNPFGYGALGTRHVIYYYHDVGHCHQLFLEILVDFGIFLGMFIIMCIMFRAFKIITDKRNIEWKAVFIIFFARACQLILSGTYWHVASFWACIGIGVAIYCGNKRPRRIVKT